MRDAYIYDAVRSPRGKGRANGSLHEVTPAKLSADMLNALAERNNLEGQAVCRYAERCESSKRA